MLQCHRHPIVGRKLLRSFGSDHGSQSIATRLQGAQTQLVHHRTRARMRRPQFHPLADRCLDWSPHLACCNTCCNILHGMRNMSLPLRGGNLRKAQHTSAARGMHYHAAWCNWSRWIGSSAATEELWVVLDHRHRHFHHLQPRHVTRHVYKARHTACFTACHTFTHQRDTDCIMLGSVMTASRSFVPC